MNIAIAPQRAVLLIVDIQERLAAAMPRKVMEQVERYTGVLVEMARRMSVPVVLTQQYPRGLGPTVPAVEEVPVSAGSARRLPGVAAAHGVRR